MAKRKQKTSWQCTACGATTRGWFGQCPSCGEWNTIEEVVDRPTAGERVVLRSATSEATVVPVTQAQAQAERQSRLRVGIGELDRVLGGGLVPGSVVLVGGAPGIGKSTLLLQACAAVVAGGSTVLYASSEESVAQVAGRAARLRGGKFSTHDERLLLLAETRIESILDAAAERRPDLLVVDSIQTVYSDAQDGLPGNISQIRSVTGHLLSWAKGRGVPVIVVGHVTKDGQLAGPRLLEHMVDAVLSFEGDDERATRMLRATKNRFGSTAELGVFEMTGVGLSEVANPSEAFLADHPGEAIGSAVTASLEGSRPLLLEVQALLGPSPGGSPRRTCVGADPARLAMLLAVLDRHAGLFVVDQDVFVNVAGGLRLSEPAADLAVLLAVASSHMRKPIPRGTLAIGEVGLTGELRRVPRLGERLAEAARLGFTRAIVPHAKLEAGAPADAAKIDCVAVHTVSEAIERCF
ncbi:DNA repair protein RadA [Pseudenhygromyxa sp. WMMC2535]|uniref:DNA repair protein RadA n=1 Tax=Pseudenhygromyxa sp. WMMC2535 TaxID=2712867 RepID=UPI001553E9AF|nr:DNA repair protein RadA [Pseudenhygromyxa sp. WMMC2535]NVB36360.1 DNA repair protein RadA [Pseudenhygromyxa sp. WMMC2535]